MTRPVVGTILSRVAVQGMNLLVIMLAGHRLGAEGLGHIGLIVLGITIVVLINNIVGGAALVYLAPRVPLSALLRPAYGWAVLTLFLAWGLVRVLPLVDTAYRDMVVVLAFIQSFYTIHLNILIGQQRIATVNRIQVLQAGVLLAVFAWRVLPDGRHHVMDYVIASLAAFAITLVTSSVALFQRRVPPTLGLERPLREVLWRQGGLVQSANLLQLLNYRFAYFLIQHFLGTAVLGIYTVGTQLAEAAWIAPKSLGTVLYSRISNEADEQRRGMLALVGMKAAVVMALVVLLLLLLLPDPLYQWAFGKEVEGISPVLLLLGPGILAMAASQAFSHYFSGTGRNLHNTVSSGIGLLITVAAGWWLIPVQGVQGAALTASLAYAGNVLYQLVVFLRLTGGTVIDLLPHAGDLRRLRGLWQSAFGR